MEDTLIIISSLKYAYDIRKLIEEKFPELKLKVFIDNENDAQKKDNTTKDGGIDLEDFLKKIGPNETNPTPPSTDPWPSYPRDVVLMYGCPITPFHTISSAEEALQNKDFNSNTNSNTNSNAKNEI